MFLYLLHAEDIFGNHNFKGQFQGLRLGFKVWVEVRIQVRVRVRGYLGWSR